MKVQTHFDVSKVVCLSGMKEGILYRATNETGDVCYRKGEQLVYLTGKQTVLPAKQMEWAKFIPLSIGESITLIQDTIT